MSEFTEISLMARCLEKILQVDLVPGFYGTENQALAVISNPFIRPTVSLRSLFWEVRFLSKIHHFLDRLDKSQNGRASSKLPNDEERGNRQGEKAENNALAFFSEFDGYERSQMLSIAESQCNRIRDAIERIILFLLDLLLPLGLSPLQPQYPTDESEFYYITMTIWYVVKSFPKVVWKSPNYLYDFEQKDLTNSCVPPDSHNFGAIDKRKISLLKWYHYSSLLSLADRGVLPRSWISAPMKKRVYSLNNAATMAYTESIDIKSHYSVDNEIVDRLSFLAHELGMEEFDATDETVTSASIQRVRGRELMKYLNPGVSLPKGRGYSFQETFGPWEIHALCHNSRINVLTLESESEYVKATKDYGGSETREEEVALYKNKVYRFLNSEATLIPYWERSPTKMRSGWLQSEAAAGFIMGTPDGFDKGALSNQFREILKELEGTDVRPIDWASFHPPRQYYPDSFIKTLEDTPHLFRPPVTDDVFIPATLAKFDKPQGRRVFSRDDLENVQKSFSILDILVSQQILSPRKRKISGGRNTRLPDMRYYRLGATVGVTRGKGALIETSGGENELVRALFDSLVDKSTHPQIDRKTHSNACICSTPEAVACLSNHVLHTPRFSFHKGPTWMTSITVGSWILTKTERKGPKYDSVMANESIELPCELEIAARSQGGDRALTSPQSRVSFFVSSVVLTTNAFGDFSRCTVISEDNDENIEAKPGELVAVAEISNEIWQVFVHQPQTARCLVFLHELGMLCSKLCKQYRDTITEFESIMHSTDALCDEGDWFQNSLKTSITNIIDAKRELLGQINEQAANRSLTLQGMCQEYIANFESGVVELTQVNEYLASNIALAMRFKDALSGTLALRDSRVGLNQNEISLEQNNAIQALTYLTIGYLPLGLITVSRILPSYFLPESKSSLNRYR
ncbi:hypothetical protein F4823DRAFT_567462 [Ustulina deusta]|nr:hypothetical protein F4823DRAFT_567462 [Ustulina deusta]